MTDEVTARKTWELMNNVQYMEMDEIFKFDEKKHDEIVATDQWRTDPECFKHVKMSAVALLKMVMHACAGGTQEIMGLMLGKIQGDTIIVMDSFSLPVLGTETRVNPGDEAEQYMIDYTENNILLGRKERTCGWYHSHPGYGCWLSGIDVRTQDTQQQLGPYIAVVVDPVKSVRGKVVIGAFRTIRMSNPLKPEKEPRETTSFINSSFPLSNAAIRRSLGIHYYQMNISYRISKEEEDMLRSLNRPM